MGVCTVAVPQRSRSGVIHCAGARGLQWFEEWVTWAWALAIRHLFRAARGSDLFAEQHSTHGVVLLGLDVFMFWWFGHRLVCLLSFQPGRAEFANEVRLAIDCFGPPLSCTSLGIFWDVHLVGRCLLNQTGGGRPKQVCTMSP